MATDNEMKFSYKKKLKKVEGTETKLKIVGKDQDGNPITRKIDREVFKDVNSESTEEALANAKKEAVKQGFVDVSLEAETDATYEFRFYNPIKLARSVAEKNKEKEDAKKQK